MRAAWLLRQFFRGRFSYLETIVSLRCTMRREEKKLKPHVTSIENRTLRAALWVLV